MPLKLNTLLSFKARNLFVSTPFSFLVDSFLIKTATHLWQAGTQPPVPNTGAEQVLKGYLPGRGQGGL